MADSPTVTIIIPARNEEAPITACLNSLLAQDHTPSEIVVVDDHSTDQTAAAVRTVAGGSPRPIRLIQADSIPTGWTGKNWALAQGVKAAAGTWLLFLDADVRLAPQALGAVLQHVEAVDALSLSPEQECDTFWEAAIQPVVFEFLAAYYPYEAVSDPASPKAAANGQFFLVRRSAYDAVGGHESVKGEILEDVSLAKRFKARGFRFAFQPGLGLVRTRMYHSLPALVEGWSKNLWFLCDARLSVVLGVTARWLLRLSPFLLGLAFLVTGAGAPEIISGLALLLGGYARAWRALARIGFASWTATLAYPLGTVAFLMLLALSSLKIGGRGRVTWKGRIYPVSDGPGS